tara:strand:- start:5974 stop:6435 length:462 start_codon:yes stop_codon:yes gene_type:complete
MINVYSLNSDKLIVDALRLGFRFWEETPIFNKYKWNSEKAYEFLSSISNNDNSCGYIAYIKEEPVGLVLGEVVDFYFSEAKFLEDKFIYILPEHRGSKAAYLLMKEYIKFGESKKVDDIFFQVSAGIDNEKSIKFLSKFGFNVMAYGLIKEKL